MVLIFPRDTSVKLSVENSKIVSVKEEKNQIKMKMVATGIDVDVDKV